MRSRIRPVMIALVLSAGALSGSLAHAANGSWSTGGPNGKSIKEIVAHPNNPNILYAGAFGLGVFKSVDGGVTWRGHKSGLRNSFVRCLALDSARPETLYAGTNDGLYRSTDGDSTWTLLFDASSLTTPTSVRAVALDRFNPGTIYVGTYDDGIFKSVNHGASWTAINLGLANTSIRCITIHPTNPDTVLAGTGTNGGVHISTDGGFFWSQIPDTAVSVSAAVKILYDPLRSTRIYVASGSHGVIVSQDGGATWKRLARGLTSFLTRSLALRDTVRYVGTDSSGVFYSTLSDSLWHEVNSGLSSRQVDALFARSRTDVWAGTDGGGMFHTLNAGGSWTQVDGGLLRTDIFALGVSPTASHVYSGAGFGDQFWTSTNQGGAWTRAAGLQSIHNSVQAIANGAGSPSVVYAAITGVGVLKSFDNGASWVNPDSSTQTLNQGLGALASHPVNPGVLYAGATSGVYKSINGGSTWMFASTGLPAQAHIKSLGLNPLKPDTLYAGTDSLGLFLSMNGGATWGAVGAGIPSPYIRDIACDPVTSGVVYVATDAGIFRSANQGASWSPRNTGLPATPSVRAIVYDRTHPNVWFAGVWQAGVFRSVDGGATWTSQLGGLGSLNVKALAIDPVSVTLYAGTQAGTYQFTNYPISNVGLDEGAPLHASLRGWPNPFHASVVFSYSAAAHEDLRLEIFDLAGRRVRRLPDRQPRVAGPVHVAWDGRDDRGSVQPAGVYLARLSGAAGVQHLRLALVR
jgi:hypothetical protein